MENNKSTLTLSQALKLYNGDGMARLTIKFSAIMTALYLGTIVLFTTLIGLENGFAAAYKEISKELMSNLFLAIDGGIAIGVISVLTYEKKLPGGKFFRSVKGGFETYKKMRTALKLTTVIGICLYTGIICAVNALFPIMVYGTATCISVLIFLLLGTGIVNLINMIKNDLARSLLNIFVLFILGFVGVFTVWFKNGSLGIFHLIMAIITVGVVPVSHKIMLENYRKNRWDN